MRRRIRSWRGSVTIELLGSFPIWLLLLLIFLQIFQAGRTAIRAETAAAHGARAMARGNSTEAAVRRVSGPLFWRLDREEQVGCEIHVTVTLKAPIVLVTLLSNRTIPIQGQAVWPAETGGC